MYDTVYLPISAPSLIIAPLYFEKENLQNAEKSLSLFGFANSSIWAGAVAAKDAGKYQKC